MSIDVDDVLAVAIAHALADLGEVNLVAVLLNVNLREGASTISAINRYFGHDVPIGMYDGPLGDPARCAATPAWVNSCRGFYATDVARRYPTFALQNQSALELYRQALHDATDGSIRIASIGFASNLRDLLRSPPDALSPLSGEELLQRKVTKMYMMGGRRLNGNPVSILSTAERGPIIAIGALSSLSPRAAHYMTLRRSTRPPIYTYCLRYTALWHRS